jgi:hypothetical protein
LEIIHGEEYSELAASAARACNCGISRNTWGNEVLIGKLVVIVPKTIVLGEQNQALAFSYSPEKYSNDEIDEHIQSFLQGLDLSEDKAHIIESDVIMNTWGFPGLIGFGGSDHYRTYDFDRIPQFIDPDNVTVWNMWPKQGNTQSEGLYDFALRIFYSGNGHESVFCGEVCLPNNFPDEVPPSHMEVNLVLQGQTSE